MLHRLEPVYGESPAATALRDIRKLNHMNAAILTPEAERLRLNIGFWEKRKVRGIRSIFYLAYNYECQKRANEFRAKYMAYIHGYPSHYSYF